ncbi:heavy-metal-associated domain-containing protein [Microbacterium sp. A196]|uniref:heavy-metal-associated domain-containing protein n=1 Tax=unclassified Microbacterium TaxID=2609290 RepID=UPI003FD0B677
MSTHDITLKIDGMTCGHCVSSVTEELSAVAGVNSVAVDLAAGGTSTATVSADAAISNSALEAAVAEAGYALVSIDS